MTILERIEREQIASGDRSWEPASVATLVELLRRRARELPSSMACAFLNDAGRETERLSYAELDAAARRIATRLQASISQGARALLLFPAGLDFLKAFFGCMYAGVIAIPAPPPEASRLKRTLPRLRSIAADAGVSVVISNAINRSIVAGSDNDVPGLESIAYLDIGEIPQGESSSWLEPGLSAEDVAYLQYTSGSTTSPKGVMISHGNVVHHLAYLQRVCEYTPQSVSVTWLPNFHDYGLIEGLLEPIFNGTPGYVMSPFSFLKRPFNWLQAISLQRATHTQAPNFAYDQCVRRIRPDQLVQLDLGCLRSAGNGAEPINPRVLERFHRTFAPQGFQWEAFCPAYGLAEATLMVSCCSPSLLPRVARFQAEALGENRVVESTDDGRPAREVVSCGRIVCEFDVVIVDPERLTLCASDRVGEIWISDPSVAQGYWRRDDETRATFNACLADTGKGPFLRTGDLGFVLDGELFVTSRIKDLIIIAGANHYPQDIEWTVEKAHADVRPSGVAAFSIMADGEERLIVAAEIERGSIEGPDDTAQILDAIRRAVAEEHEVSVHALLLLARGSLPKTASGKVQRHGCWRLFEVDSSEVLAKWVAGNTRLGQPASGH